MKRIANQYNTSVLKTNGTAENNVSRFIEGHEVVKIIVIPGKIVNVVIK